MPQLHIVAFSKTGTNTCTSGITCIDNLCNVHIWTDLQVYKRNDLGYVSTLVPIST